MTTQYTENVAKIAQSLVKLRDEIPQAMQGFDLLAESATRSGLLSGKTKELIALAIAISTHCQDCIAHHVNTLIKLQVTREELLELLEVCTYMGGGPSLMFAVDALNAFDQLINPAQANA